MTSTKNTEAKFAVKEAQRDLELAELAWKAANLKAREANDAAKQAAAYHSECQQKLTDALRAAIAEEGAK